MRAVVKMSTSHPYLSLIPFHEAGKCQVSNISSHLSPARWSFYFSERTLNRIPQRSYHLNVPSWLVFRQEQRRRRKLPIKLNPQAQTSHYRLMLLGKCPGPPPPSYTSSPALLHVLERPPGWWQTLVQLFQMSPHCWQPTRHFCRTSFKTHSPSLMQNNLHHLKHEEMPPSSSISKED